MRLSQPNGERRDSTGGPGLSELCSDLSEAGDRLGARRARGIEQRDQRIRDGMWVERILDKFGRQCATREHVDERDVGDLDDPSRQGVGPRTRPIPNDEWTLGNRGLERGRPTLAQRRIGGAQYGEG